MLKEKQRKSEIYLQLLTIHPFPSLMMGWFKKNNDS